MGARVGWGWGNSLILQYHWGWYSGVGINANANHLQGHQSLDITMPHWCPRMLLSDPWVRRPPHKASRAFLVSPTWLDKKALVLSMYNFLPSSCCDWGGTPGSHPVLLSTAIPLTTSLRGAHSQPHRECLTPGVLSLLPDLHLLSSKAEFSRCLLGLYFKDPFRLHPLTFVICLPQPSSPYPPALPNLLITAVPAELGWMHPPHPYLEPSSLLAWASNCIEESRWNDCKATKGAP